MKRFEVTVRIWDEVVVEIEAENEQDAKEKILKGGSKDVKYSYYSEEGRDVQKVKEIIVK